MNPTRVKLHPHSYKYLAKGHPWVTRDSYTQRFPKESLLLVAKEPKSNRQYLLLQDPEHSQVAARVWQVGDEEVSEQFEKTTKSTPNPSL
jgi:hypothetical protein